MATFQKTVDYITDQLTTVGDIRSRKMFGEYVMYCREIVVALVCDNQLYVKITEPGRKLISQPQEAPPYPGAKPYFLISEEDWDNREWLSELFVTTRDALPTPKLKRFKTSKRSS